MTFTRQVDKLPPPEVLSEIDREVNQEHLEKTLMDEGLKKFADPQKALCASPDRRKSVLPWPRPRVASSEAVMGRLNPLNGQRSWDCWLVAASAFQAVRPKQKSARGPAPGPSVLPCEGCLGKPQRAPRAETADLRPDIERTATRPASKIQNEEDGPGPGPAHAHPAAEELRSRLVGRSGHGSLTSAPTERHFMALDPYAACPGGTGKKIKFCCPDLVAELDKIEHMLDADQHAGCLDYIDSLENKYPDRACLLSVKALLEAQLGMEEKAQSTLARYTDKYPQNPVALAEKATLIADQRRGPAGDRGAASRPSKRPNRHAAALVSGDRRRGPGAVGRGTDPRGPRAPAAATEHRRDEGRTAAQNAGLAEPLVGDPALVQTRRPLLPPPDDAPGRQASTPLLELAGRGAWRAAEKKLVELIQKVGDSPVLWRNLATLRGWLADNAGRGRALRKYAAAGSAGGRGRGRSAGPVARGRGV